MEVNLSVFGAEHRVDCASVHHTVVVGEAKQGGLHLGWRDLVVVLTVLHTNTQTHKQG